MLVTLKYVGAHLRESKPAAWFFSSRRYGWCGGCGDDVRAKVENMLAKSWRLGSSGGEARDAKALRSESFVEKQEG